MYYLYLSKKRIDSRIPGFSLVTQYLKSNLSKYVNDLWGHQAASDVKTEVAGEIGDPNLLYDQVSR